MSESASSAYSTSTAEFDLEPLAGARLEPFLRSLLVHPGVMARALAAHARTKVNVTVRDQRPVAIPPATATLLRVVAHSEAIRRRVDIGLAHAAGAAITAESFMIPRRLPPDFFVHLSTSDEGIGGVLADLRLMTCRELLRFGLASRVPWDASGGSVQVLIRQYRIVVSDHPAILITEAFTVEVSSGQLRLANASRAGGQSA